MGVALVALFAVSCTKSEDEAVLTPADSADELSSDESSEEELSNDVFSENSPWVTTAVYAQLADGTMDTSVNLINTEVAKGTVSSAQYRDGEFIFVTAIVDETTGLPTGDFDAGDDNYASLLNNWGAYSVKTDDGKSYRDLSDTNLGYSNSREITEATSTKFTYLVEVDGTNYYVEHEPYSTFFPSKTYPADLEAAVTAKFEELSEME